MKSGNRINYLLRPAKAVERRMMAEVFLRLMIFAPLDTYQYVGMGSWYFADFHLFHATCGFGAMVSIEATTNFKEQRRCEYNVPVGIVELYFETTTSALPQLDWDRPSVVWLDFDYEVNRSVLGDLRLLVSRASSGSLLAVSAKVDRRDIKAQSTLVAHLTECVGSDKIPVSALAVTTVTPRNYQSVIRDVLTAEIELAVSDRNAGSAPEECLQAIQVFYYVYADGAEMLTLGWLILNAADMLKLPACHFPRLKHALAATKPFIIEVPLLTPAEMRALNRVNDVDTFEVAANIPVPRPEKAKFYRLQRHWPSFHTSELM